MSYLAYLCILVLEDEPLIQTSYEYLDKLSIPGILVNETSKIYQKKVNLTLCLSSHKDIEVCGLYSDIEISRCVFTWDDDSKTTYVGCNEFLYQPVRIK